VALFAGAAKGAVKAVRLVSPVVAIARTGEDGPPPGGDLAIVGGAERRAARLREVLGACAGSPEAALVAVAAPEDAEIPVVGELFGRRRDTGLRSVAVITGDPETRRARERALREASPPVPVSEILHVNTLEGDDAAGIAERVVKALGADATAAARRTPELRAPLGRLVIDESCRQAAIVGALPLGAADMPALGMIQVRMLARLAAVHDRPLGPERGLEALAVIGAGFGWRALGRASARAMPRWVAGGGVAYGGTRAVGEAALARLQAGHDPIDAGPLEKLRPQVERVLGRLGGG
jgi:uncharacterized protein (DUF697 family)